MTVTAPMINRVLKAMEARNIKKKDIAKAVGLGSSWVTKFLSCDLQVLKPEHRFALEDLLGIELMDARETDASPQAGLSPRAFELAQMIDSNPAIAAFADLLASIGKPKAEVHYIIPTLSSKELTKLGGEATRFVNKWDDPAGNYYPKIGTEIVRLMAKIIADKQKKAAKKTGKPSA